MPGHSNFLAPATVLAVILMAGLSSAATPAQQVASFAVPGTELQQADYPADDAQASVFPDGGAAPYVNLVDMTFPADSVLIPFDPSQTSLTDGFGFVHAMLRNGSTLFRIIGPPAVLVKTEAYPSGGYYQGGPIMFLPADQTVANTVRGAFPSLVLHKVTEEFSSSAVFVMNTPTKILLISGVGVGFGRTYELLDAMKIPYTHIMFTFTSVPAEIWNGYDLVVDDCPGMFNMNPYPSDPFLAECASNFRAYVAEGHEIIFTCCAFEVRHVFPEYLWVQRWSDWGVSRDAVIYNVADFPAQYGGPEALTIDNIYTNVTIKSSNVTVMSKSNESVEACYFYFGSKGGIAEYFTFHPGEQMSQEAYRMAVTLYGNKFLHITPLDTGIGRESVANPSEIAVKGEGNQQIGEQAKISLSLKAIGAPITAQSSFRLNYELMPYIESVSGSFLDDYGTQRPPDYLATNPNGSTTLYWNVASIPNGKYWNVSFNVTSTVAGEVFVNAGIRSNITFYDSQGQRRVMTMKALKITVLQDVAEVPAFALATGAGLSIFACAATAWARRKR